MKKEQQQNEAKNRNLLRFVHAQDSGGIYDGAGTYAQALQEVRAGHKRGHWIWYVFPQMKGLGKRRSQISMALMDERRQRLTLSIPYFVKDLLKSARQFSIAIPRFMTFLVAMLSKSGPAYCCLPPSVTSLFSSKSRANIGGKTHFYAEVLLIAKNVPNT